MEREMIYDNLPPVIDTTPWMLTDGGALDVDICPDCWERRAHIERYVFACRVCTGMRVLDFGCGVGYGSEMLWHVRNDVTGVDSSMSALKLARSRERHLHPRALEFAESVPDGAQYDACVALEVLEHMPEPEQFLATVPARHLIVSVPVRSTVGENPHHLHDFTLDGFRQMLERQRWEIRSHWVQVEPFHAEPSVGIWHAERKV